METFEPMAHRTNVTQVMTHLENKKHEFVTDAVCGKSIDKHASKNMLFRENTTYYFCSKECQTRFIYPMQKKVA
jgi:YHS domain-containing protein